MAALAAAEKAALGEQQAGKASVPPLRARRPELLKAVENVAVAVPADLVSTPVLLNVARPPPWLLRKLPSKATVIAPLLLKTEAAPVPITPAVQVMLPALLMLRTVKVFAAGL